MSPCHAMAEKTGPGDSAYSGRWVARIRGKIVGQGGTPEAARRAAGANRHKEKAAVEYMHTPWDPPASHLIPKIVAVAPRGDIYLVGGAVRDALLGRVSHDFDFVVSENALRLARQVASALEADFYVLDEEFGAARVIVTGEGGTRDILDFTAMRGGSIEVDLAARDFSINAIALNARDGTTLDPLHGASDVLAGIVRACGPTAMKDDAIRVLRAVRLAAALEFKIETGTRRDLKAAAHLLPGITEERKRDELFRILSGPRASACMRAVEMLGVFPHFLPELGTLRGVQQSAPHVHDVWDHTLSVMRHLEEILDLVLDEPVQTANGLQSSLFNLGIGRYRQRIAEYFSEGQNPERPLRGLLQFAALYHDVGKRATQTSGDDGRIHFIGHEKDGAQVAAERARGLNLSNSEVDWLQTAIANHLRFFILASRAEAEGDGPSRQATFRFFRDTGFAGVALILLGLADLRGTRDHELNEKTWSAWVAVARALLESLWERPEEVVAPPRVVDGNDLIQELSLRPGPTIGLLLKGIREAQAAGDIKDREDALAFARNWITKGADMKGA